VRDPVARQTQHSQPADVPHLPRDPEYSVMVSVISKGSGRWLSLATGTFSIKKY
jgi:hypothetical protein